MKKVRFETPSKLVMETVQDYECHSPRPFVERQVLNIEHDLYQPRPVVFTNDPVQRFETGNCSPYPVANKTYLNCFPRIPDNNVPSSDLDLSILDCSQQKFTSSTSHKRNNALRTVDERQINSLNIDHQQTHLSPRVLSSIENKTKLNPPNILNKDDFFLRRKHLGNFSLDPYSRQLKQLTLNKENDPHIQKNELIRIGSAKTQSTGNSVPTSIESDDHCRCHHCIKPTERNMAQHMNRNIQLLHTQTPHTSYNPHSYATPSHNCSCTCNMHIIHPMYHCNVNAPSPHPQNAVDKKTWAIEKYEKNQKVENLEIEKPNNVFKEKREPTVADLFKIIKLQNEQLQLLQEKVDKFISTHHGMQDKHTLPVQSYVTDQMAVQTVNSEQHKISIGVMTSFEMVRTSTVINKEIVKQSEAQIQCNRSQISIKEVVSKKQGANLNFLDGIQPVSKNIDMIQINDSHIQSNPNSNDTGSLDALRQTDNIAEDKTLNELSLYNVQVDNATTPLMSPDQSLYLDIRDYSESDSGSDDQSNVGWTYYNKVMTHVNGMLQDSDMPSSASALYRHTKKNCLQMQIDKSNVSVGKRVTFGDTRLDVQQPLVNSPSDTSLKMNQLAVKYLKNSSPSHTPSPKGTGEMSFATKNYMKKHNLLQGQQFGQGGPPQPDIPKFLDITALKQQPKFI